MKHLKLFESFKKFRPEWFISKVDYRIAVINDDDLMSIENDLLTPEGLIAKMENWNEAEHGVEATIYDMTLKQLKDAGYDMPEYIKRIERS